MNYKNILATSGNEIQKEASSTLEVCSLLEKLIETAGSDDLIKLCAVLHKARLRFNIIRYNLGSAKSGPKIDALRDKKIQFALSVVGSWQCKTDAVNEKFGSKHCKSTIHLWCKQ